jgi:micrococcal nuclease
MPYEYHATVTDVVDGDTLTVDIDLGFDVKFKNQKIRLLGVDTPESRTKDSVEKTFGLVSKEYVKKFVDACGSQIVLRTYVDDTTDDSGREKFGRLLGEVINPTTKVVLNNDLIARNYAVKYLGENKINVADLHKANRKALIDRGEVKLTYEQAGLKKSV